MDGVDQVDVSTRSTPFHPVHPMTPSPGNEAATFPSQAAEWLPARTVLLCAPGAETLFALLDTQTANFQRPFPLERARAEHRAYRATLEAHGVEVIDLREALIRHCDRDTPALDRLRGWARQSVSFDFDPQIPEAERAPVRERTEAAVRVLDPGSLADLILLRPKLHVRREPQAPDPARRHATHFEVEPASNAYYTRDPMITTAAGCVIGRLRLGPRYVENEIIEHVLTQLGVVPLYRVREPGHLEGGDFFPCGDFCLQGQGLLTDEEGVRQCLEHRVYGFVEVGVVRDPRCRMDEMHLDTYFTVFARDLCALCDNRVGDLEPEVDVWVPEGTPDQFRYRLDRTVPFRRYLAEKGFTIIPFSKADQRAYAPNGLVIRERHFIGVRGVGEPYARELARHGVAVQWLEFDALTGGYGGPHCSSQALYRSE